MGNVQVECTRTDVYWMHCQICGIDGPRTEDPAEADRQRVEHHKMHAAEAGGTGRGLYTCERCGGTFEKTRSDEEALAEAESLWTPETMADPQAVICDDCFREFIAWARVNVPEALR